MQEEPANQGAWPRMALRLPELTRPAAVRLVSLPASSAPAFGSAKVHAATHRELIENGYPGGGLAMYFTDAGIEELDDRRGDEQVSMSWLAERLRDFVDLNPEFETAVDRLASWLARLDADAESDDETPTTQE